MTTRGLLYVAKEAWEQQPSPHRTLVEHVGDMTDRMATGGHRWPLVREHMSGPTEGPDSEISSSEIKC